MHGPAASGHRSLRGCSYPLLSPHGVTERLPPPFLLASPRRFSEVDFLVTYTVAKLQLNTNYKKDKSSEPFEEQDNASLFAAGFEPSLLYEDGKATVQLPRTKEFVHLKDEKLTLNATRIGCRGFDGALLEPPLVKQSPEFEHLPGRPGAAVNFMVAVQADGAELVPRSNHAPPETQSADWVSPSDKEIWDLEFVRRQRPPFPRRPLLPSRTQTTPFYAVHQHIDRSPAAGHRSQRGAAASAGAHLHGSVRKPRAQRGADRHAKATPAPRRGASEADSDGARGRVCRATHRVRPPRDDHASARSGGRARGRNF